MGFDRVFDSIITDCVIALCQVSGEYPLENLYVNIGEEHLCIHVVWNSSSLVIVANALRSDAIELRFLQGDENTFEFRLNLLYKIYHPVDSELPLVETVKTAIQEVEVDKYRIAHSYWKTGGRGQY